MTELLTCPFCGGEARVFHFSSAIRDEVWRAVCDKPFCAQGPDGYTEAEAIAAWNTRAERIYATGGIIAQAECRDVCASISEFTCSSCGFNCDLTSWISLFDGDSGRHRHHHFGTPNYCPNCGARVVGE